MHNIDINRLKENLDLAIVKDKQKTSDQSSSIAYSENNQMYEAGSVYASDTHLLTMSSEQLVLSQSIHNNDFKVNKIITLLNSETKDISPLVIKILIDHIIRTGTNIEYTVINKKGEIIFQNNNILKILPFYRPPTSILSKTKEVLVSKNYISIDNPSDPKASLKKYALLGLLRNFPTHDSASGYGTSILTDKNNIYFGGQYSSFDKRLNIHSEVATILDVLMNKNKEKPIQLGIVSTKHTDNPCQICGCCRQFISEISTKLNLNITLNCFAKDTDRYSVYSIGDILPNKWSNKN